MSQYRTNPHEEPLSALQGNLSSGVYDVILIPV
jgi:hypothetical protein